MDKKIRAAAAKESGEYDEKNWQDMKVLLDKHLPQQKGRRRMFFLLFAVLGLSGYLLISGTSQNKKSEPQQKTIPATSAVGEKMRSIPGTANPLSFSKNVAIKNTVEDLQSVSPQEDGNITGESSLKSGRPLAVNPAIAPALTDVIPGNSLPVAGQDKNSPAENTAVSPISAPTLPGNTDSSVAAASNPSKKNPKPKKKNSKISFNFSFGPDITSVGLNRRGKFKSQYGVGIGYAVSDRISIRTGFYAGRKIYSADSTNYHIHVPGIYSYKLSDVNANCFVYEMPVNMVYNFKQSKNHNWFVSTGLSSYLMKTEAYQYNFKNPNGQTLTHRYNFRNENTHYLSVLNFSGGYQYHFNKSFCILAEPYVKVPLSGVGVGKVRLNSTGILFTASVKPFR